MGIVDTASMLRICPSPLYMAIADLFSRLTCFPREARLLVPRTT